MNKFKTNMKYIISITSFLVLVLGINVQVSNAWNYNGTNINYTVTVLPSITVTLSASPTNMTLPTNQTTLTWSTTGSPDTCTATNAWSGSKAVGGGSELKTGLTAGTYTYDITCTKSGSPNANSSAVVVVNPAVPPPSPSGTISATDCTISSGGSSCNSLVTWSTSDLTGNPTEVTHNNPSATHVSWNTSGTNIPSSVNYGTTTFYLFHNSVQLSQSTMNATCVSGTTWSGTMCQDNPPPPPTTPTVTLNAAPSTVFSGNSSTLSWTSTNVSSCTASAVPASGTWTGARPTASSYPHESTGALTKTTDFKLSCTGAYGPASDTKTVTVIENGGGSGVQALLSADPERISSGESSTLTWGSVNATSCSGIGFSTGGAISGATSVSPTVNTTYTVNCINGPDSASDQATVTLKRRFLFIEF